MPALPNFLIIGAGKCGTTSAANYLMQHPDIFMPAVKEPGFFSNEDIWNRGLAWYRSLYWLHRGESVIGEATNAYSALGLYPNTVDRIKATLSNVKILYFVRHPLKRTESDWMDQYPEYKISFRAYLENNFAYRDKNRYLRTLKTYQNKRLIPLSPLARHLV